MYIRFVAGVESESPRIQNGLFTEVQYLKKNGLLAPYQEELVDNIFTFFNTNLPVPPYSKKSWSIHAISWFKDTAHEYIDRMRDLQVILEENDIHVRVLRTERPGMILYEDDFQIVSQSRIY